MADIETIVIDSSDSEQGPPTSSSNSAADDTDSNTNMDTMGGPTTPTNESEILLPKSNLT